MAPPVDQTTAADFASNIAFLYTGANRVQDGVAAGAITPLTAAVVRGLVTKADGTALSGVTITVHGHPEFGYTLSRTDGRFDMAVTGGGLVTLDYQAAGYLPGQRQVQAPWRDFVSAPTVSLIPVDSQATTVDVSGNSSSMQVGQANAVTDTDGSRRATLLFPTGTQATMTMPDGSTSALTTANVRATEYTVGPNGPQAMPAELPPASAYTYAVEFSADEALAAGAMAVTFSQPVIFYLENFLNFPVGEKVPVGYYDRGEATWVPSADGRVVKILSTSGGVATVDTTGQGTDDIGLGPMRRRSSRRSIPPDRPCGGWR